MSGARVERNARGEWCVARVVETDPSSSTPVVTARAPIRGVSKRATREEAEKEAGRQIERGLL